MIKTLCMYVPYLVLGSSVWGAIVDRRYMKRGGTRPSRNELVGLVAVGLFLAVLLYLDYRFTAKGAFEARVALFSGIFLFGTWELERWKIRRKSGVIGNLPSKGATGHMDE